MPSAEAPIRDRQARRAGRIALASLLLLLGGVAAVAGPVPERSSPEPRSAAASVLDEPALVSAVEPPTADAASAAVPTIDALQREIAAVLEREGVPGVGLALVDRDGVRWAGGVGVMDLETGRPVDADTHFRVASITKSVVGLGVMRLVEEGRLDLDAPLAALMPEIAVDNPWEDAAPITLAHALEHTAGFDDMRFNEWFGDDGTAPGDALTINPRSRQARWRPGSRMSYSNPGYTIAGYAIERATGESYEDYLRREVLAPLGMESARFRRTPELAGRLATGHTGPRTPAVFRPISHAPAGALLASPRELAGLVHFWIRRGDGGPAIVGPESMARIERTETLPYRGTDGNYGLGNYGDVLHPVVGRGHDGGLPGFLSCYRYFPELGVGYVMLLNATHSARAYVEIRALLFAYLTRDRELPARPIAPPDGPSIAAAAGYYGLENPRIELFSFIDRAIAGLSVRPSAEGVVLERLIGGEIAMVPTGDGGYRHPREGGTSVRFTADADGERILVAGMAYFESGSFAFAWTRLAALQAALMLLQLAPLWSLAWALAAGVRRLRGRRSAPGEAALHLWSGLAGILFFAMLLTLAEVLRREAFISANPLSIGLCAVSIAFAAASALAVAEAVRAHVRGVIHWFARLVPSAAALAAFGMTLYLLRHHIIGLRFWAW